MPPSPERQAGRVVGDRYRIESPLGSGGMGVLYVAEHLFTGRRVALKLLHPSREDDEFKARLLSEARTASAVRHPHVVDVLDMGADEHGQPFLVMELLEGRSLDQVLAQGALEPEKALAWLLPVVGALAALHDAGIVHRDLKPSNIFLSRRPQGRVEAKLLDFGLARAVSDLRLTRSGAVIGTPLYMAPEHAAGTAVNAQADVWSMGIVLYECLAGQSPYRASDNAAVAAQVLTGRVVPLHEVRPDLPQPLVNAVERALRRDLAFRYRDMRGFAEGLLSGAAASGLSVPEDPDPLGLPEFPKWHAAAYGSPLRTTTTEPRESWLSLARVCRSAAISGIMCRRRRTWQRPLVGLLVLIAMAAAVYVGIRRPPEVAAPQVKEPPPPTLDSSSAPGELLPSVEPLTQKTPGVSAATSAAPPPEEPQPRFAPVSEGDSSPRRVRRKAPARAPSADAAPEAPPTVRPAPVPLDVATEWK